uniref:Si:ch73-190m4.1 n=1 Tax=Cyprinus carpio TaxID=7962 RepID=A0A8C1U906_CYPCA
MLCFWGAQVRAGLGLVKPDQVRHGNSGIRSVCPKTAVQDMSAGRSFAGFIRDGTVSVLRLRSEDYDHDGKLKQLQLKNKIRLIVCGGDGAVLLANGGKVLIMDKSTVCKPLKGLENRQVIQIACGDHHSVALTNDGQVFVWGENSHGQLGLRKDHPGSPSAQHVQSLSGVPLAQISAGGDHSFVLSLSGVVFGWGKNSAGQLGLGDTTDRHVPTVVNSLNRKKTVSISCGGEHTATLSKGGTVFTFGSGGCGQLGHKSFRDEHHPRVVAELWGSEVSQVTCGRHHTLVSVASSKMIYSFGCGTQGQLGNGEMINKYVPCPVDIPTECNDEYTIEKLIAGENHSFALSFKEPGNESKPNPSRGILTLEDGMIGRWLSKSEPWKMTKKGINKVFSSAASLNGSFLKTSCDQHYQTSEDHCGLDFDLVKKSFAKLSKNESLISEVVKVVLQTLLPSLNPNPTGVESLRVYLLVPELIRRLKKQQKTENRKTEKLTELTELTKLTEALASKILQLDPDSQKVLEKYWSKLPDGWLKGLVKLCKKASAYLIGKIAADSMNLDIKTRLPKSVQILQMVYQVCCSANRNITKSDFIINEINDLLDVLQTINDDMINNWLMLDLTEQIQAVIDQQNYHNAILKNLISLPCIFNLEAKCSYMKNRVWQGCFPLTLRRTALLEDSFSQLRMATQEQLREFHLSVFYTEDMRRTDVNKRDFFHNVFEELCAPESLMFMYNDNQTMSWFPAQPSMEKEKYFLFGILCGLAFNNNSVVHLPFPLALFKKLLNVKPSLEDLTEFDSGLGKSLQYILNYSEDVEEMDMYYTIIWDGIEVELDPAEPGKMVTNSNREDFVDKYVDHILNKSVEEVFEEFKRGFFKACDRCIVEMFEPEELRGVLVGNEEYDWDILKQNTTYEGLFYAEHPTIISFWEVFDELTSNEKKAFLLFLTGFEKVPILGMSAVKMRVRSLIKFTQDHLPEALTCHALLDLPVYQNKETLKAKVIEAINHKRGFWEE